MKLAYLYLALVIALAVLNLIIFAIHCHRCGAHRKRNSRRAIIALLRSARKLLTRHRTYFVVVKDCSMRLGDRSTFTAMEGARVVSCGAKGTALAGSHVVAQDRAETIALEGSNVVAESGSFTHAYSGAAVRANRAGAVKLTSGVKAYARNGCRVFDEGGLIYNTGDPTVAKGLEPALVVGESESLIYAGVGSVVIAEPQVIVNPMPGRTISSVTN